MLALAQILVEAGRSVITTTSTKILYPEGTCCFENDTHAKIVEPGCVIVGPWELIQDQLKDKLRRTKHITIARTIMQEATIRKLGGYSVTELNAIEDSSPADYLLIEADGSAGRSIKAHEEYEPVLLNRPGLVIAVIGIDCLGKPMNAQYVHRAELFCERLNRPLNSTITSADVAAIVLHPKGYLHKVIQDSESIVFISKVATLEEKKQAALLAETLKRKDKVRRIDCIITGDVKDGQICLCQPIESGAEAPWQ